MILYVISVGLSVTMGLMGFINLAHGVFAMAGGYVFATALGRFGVPFPLALLLAFLFVALGSVVLERLLYSRLYGAGELAQVLFTIGLIFVAAAVARMIYGTLAPPVFLPEYMNGAVGRHQYAPALHPDLRPRQRARRPGRRAGRRHHPGAVELSVRAPGVLPDRRCRRRARVAARAVRRRAAHRHRRYSVQVLDSRVRGLPHLRRDHRHPAVAAAGPVRSARMMHGGGYTVDARIRWPEWLPWIAALAAFFLLPEYLSLGARILIYILFALSLDLILGYAGIITLGHS